MKKLAVIIAVLVIAGCAGSRDRSGYGVQGFTYQPQSYAPQLTYQYNQYTRRMEHVWVYPTPQPVAQPFSYTFHRNGRMQMNYSTAPGITFHFGSDETDD